MKKTKFSIDNKITIGAFILTAIWGYIYTQWNKPDIRYEEGNYYHTKNLSITSLQLTNYGRSDAEDIIINANFPVLIEDVASGDPSVYISVLSGGINNQSVVFSIGRIVPGQTVFIYFATDSVSNTVHYPIQEFISSITYKGGMGKTGLPFYRDSRFFGNFSLLLSLVVLALVGNGFRLQKNINKDIIQINKVIASFEQATKLFDQAIIDAKNDGIELPEIVEEFQRIVELYLYGSKDKKISED